MKKRTLVGALAAVCAVVLAALVCLLPRSTPFDWRLPCVEVSAEGEVLREGELVLTGKRQDYLLPSRRDALLLDAIQLPGLEISQVNLSQAPLFEEDSAFTFASTHVYLPQTDAPASLTLVMDRDGQWLVVQCGGRRYAAAFHGEPDIAAMLEVCGPLLS